MPSPMFVKPALADLARTARRMCRTMGPNLIFDRGGVLIVKAEWGVGEV